MCLWLYIFFTYNKGCSQSLDTTFDVPSVLTSAMMVINIRKVQVLQFSGQALVLQRDLLFDGVAGEESAPGGGHVTLSNTRNPQYFYLVAKTL